MEKPAAIMKSNLPKPAPKTPLYQAVAREIERYKRGKELAQPFAESARAELERFAHLLPSGSGVDNGTVIAVCKSRENKLVLEASFHHMNEGGFYDGWTEHTIIVHANFVHGFTLQITGRDKNKIKDYLNDLYMDSLNQMV